MPSLGLVVDELNLPGTGFEAACKSTYKVLMKKAFNKHLVPTAKFNVFKKADEALGFCYRLGFPVMIKAADSSGSRGITKVSLSEEFEFAWNRAFKVSRSKEIIVEQFLDGIKYGAEAVVHGNKVVAVFLHGDSVSPAPFITMIGHSMPVSFSHELQLKTEKVIEKAVIALGIRDCVSNADIMLVDNEPILIEIAARMGATCLPEIISIYYGYNFYEHLIRLATGEHPQITVVVKQPNACLLLQSDKTGIVSKIDIPDEVLNHPNLIDLHIDVVVGEEVNAFQVGPDRIGHIIVKEDTAIQAEELVTRFAEKVSIEVNTGKKSLTCLTP